MNRFEKKAIKIVRAIDMYDVIKKAEIITKALIQEYKNGRDTRLKKKKRNWRHKNE